MEDYQPLFTELIKLADRVTMARLGLIKDTTLAPDGDKPAGGQFVTDNPEQWENYLSYFRQTLAYLSASVRDAYATLDSPATPVQLD